MQFGLREFLPEQGRLILTTPEFDFDTFPELASTLVSVLSARTLDKQCDADIHTWLIDFEGCELFLKAEHYSEAVWFEALSVGESKEELEFLAQLFTKGISTSA